MRHKNYLTLGVLALAAIPFLTACGPNNSSGAAQESKDSAAIEKTFLLNQPPPHFQHSDIREVATEIEAIQALGEQTTSFFFNQGIKDPVFSCPSLGEPVASTTQITNQQQNFNSSYPNGGTSYPIGNMDPNGIYAGDSTGTYVLCVNAQGTPYAEYWEGFVNTVSGPATWDAGSGQIKVTGEPAMPTCTVGKNSSGKPATTCVK